jgi:hypothetical protein
MVNLLLRLRCCKIVRITRVTFRPRVSCASPCAYDSYESYALKQRYDSSGPGILFRASQFAARKRLISSVARELAVKRLRSPTKMCIVYIDVLSYVREISHRLLGHLASQARGIKRYFQ